MNLWIVVSLVRLVYCALTLKCDYLGSSLTNSSSNLNLSPQQSKLLQELILAGAQMARTLSRLEKEYSLPPYSSKPAKRWSIALMQLAGSLL